MKPTRARRGSRGAAVLELALITPVVALLVMGVLDLSRGYHLQIRLENAAREGAALAQVRPGDVGCDSTRDIRDRVLAEDGDLADVPGFDVVVLTTDDAGGFTVEVTGCTAEDGDGIGSPPAPGARVRVEARAEYHVSTPMVAQAVGSVLHLTGSTEVEVQG